MNVADSLIACSKAEANALPTASGRGIRSSANRVPRSLRSQLDRVLPWVLILGFWLHFCLPMMLGLSVVGFRDSANLYYPLFKAIDGVWQTGTLPLWNPYCNLGFPTVADGSSSVFYPGKLIFCLRMLGFPARYGVYLALHLLLAAVGSFRLARQLRCPRNGAALAAIAFAFGAPVLFQTTNVIYLVSAAWLPWAIQFVWRMLTTADWRSTLGASICCGLMFLGGDPQMVYHVGLIAAASVFVVFCGRLRKAGWRISFAWLRQRAFCLIGMVLMTCLLSAVQLAPTARLASRSERSGSNDVVNLYSAISHLGNVAAEEPVGQRVDQIQHNLLYRDSQVVGQYQFSLAPWALTEMLLPNVSGKPFPINARWTNQLASSDRMWFPSLYLGLLTIILAASQFRLWGAARRQVWLSWITLWFLLGSFGWYGAAWLSHELQFACGLDPATEASWAAPVGGVYWWMSNLIPAYVSFRYPAKLFIVGSLGLAILAGRGLPRASRWIQPTWLYALAGLLIVGTPMLSEFFFNDFLLQLRASPQAVANLPEFGPFRPLAAIDQVFFAGLHSAIVLIVVALLFHQLGRLKQGPLALDQRELDRSAPKVTRQFVLGWSLVLVLLVDVAVANRWLLAEVPTDAFETSLPLVVTPAARTSQQDPPVILANEALPSRITETSSPDRLAELIRWQRETLQAKHHLNQQIRLIGSFHSIWPRRYLETIDQLRDSSQRTRANQLHWGNAPVQQWKLNWNRAEFVIQSPRDQWVQLPVFAELAWVGSVGSANSEQGTNSNHGQSSLRPAVLRIGDNDLLECYLRAGRWNLELEYQPQTVYVGISISLVSWLIAIPVFCWTTRQRRNPFYTKRTIEQREQ